MRVLETTSLSKTFDTATVLDGIDLSVDEGEFLTVMGKSGSGKSTLLYALSGMDEPSGGTVRLAGRDLAGLSADELADLRLTTMGFVFQHNHLLDSLSIEDNICLPGFSVPGADAAAVRARARELMEKVGIAEVADHGVGEVSGGQLQRAAVCRALINSPRILLADEPTGALNSRASAEVIAILRGAVNEGMTILLVTHDPSVAAASDRVIFLADGRIGGELDLRGVAEPERRDAALAWLLELGF